MARSRQPNGMLGKAIKSLTDLIPAGSDLSGANVDVDRIRLKLRSATSLAGSGEAVRRIVGTETWAKIQQILNPSPPSTGKPTLAA